MTAAPQEAIIGTIVDIAATSIKAYDPVEAGLAQLRELYGDVSKIDVSTPKGLEEARRARAAIRQPRYDAEKIRKALKAPALEYEKRIDTEATRITAELLALETPYDNAIKAEEERQEQARQEKARVERERLTNIHAKIGEVRNLAMAALKLTSKEVAAALAQAENFICDDATFQEFTDEAKRVRSETVKQLAAAKAALEEQEAERARLKAEREQFEKEKQEQAARDKKEREEREATERQERATREREEREQRAQQAERDRIDREQREQELNVKLAQQQKIALSDNEFETLRRYLMRAHQETMSAKQWQEFVELVEAKAGNEHVVPERATEYEQLRENVAAALRTALDKQRGIEAEAAENERQFQEERAEFQRQQTARAEQDERERREKEEKKRADDERREQERRERATAEANERLRERIAKAVRDTPREALDDIYAVIKRTRWIDNGHGQLSQQLSEEEAVVEVAIICEANLSPEVEIVG